MSINYTIIPSHMQASARRYIEQGIAPGSFLTAVICNDLAGAFGRADDINLASMRDWVSFFYNEAPAPCWGSKAKMDAWLARGGMRGALAVDEGAGQ